VRFLWKYVKDRIAARRYSPDLPLEVEPYALQHTVRQALPDHVD
jgi:hypothetical protein